MKKKVSNLLQQLAPVAKQRHKNPCLTLKKIVFSTAQGVANY